MQSVRASMPPVPSPSPGPDLPPMELPEPGPDLPPMPEEMPPPGPDLPMEVPGLPGNAPDVPPTMADLPAAARRALAEAEARRTAEVPLHLPVEHGGRRGPEPVRYGDWEKSGLAIDF